MHAQVLFLYCAGGIAGSAAHLLQQYDKVRGKLATNMEGQFLVSNAWTVGDVNEGMLFLF
jgi:hypothetical protein